MNPEPGNGLSPRTKPTSKHAPQIANLYCDLSSPVRHGWATCLPGLALASLAVLAAAFIADRYGAPLTLMALLTGLSLNSLSDTAKLHAGLDFASQTLLRCGIALTGLQVTYLQIGALGVPVLLAVCAVVSLTIATGIVVARLLGQGTSFGLLAGGSVGICGASAALAIATALGERRVGHERLALVLIGIAAMSPAAMALYPIIAHRMGLSDTSAGFLLGVAIHDVSQAIGAGYSYSRSAGEVAVIVKLARVALLVPLVALIACATAKGGGLSRQAVPWFIPAFLVLAGFNSAGFVSQEVACAARDGSTSLLALALTAVAIRSPLHQLAHTGSKPLLTVAIPTVAALLAALLSVGVLF